jgi:hypothetical protein
MLSLFFVFIGFSLLPAEDKSIFTSTEYGFSINSPAIDQKSESADQICFFFLPTKNNFAANVNIQSQFYNDSIKSYDVLSLSQFKQMNLKVINHKLNKNSIIYEYVGEYQGQTLHWYAIAQKSGSYILLATATALDSLWDEQKKVLQDSVNSFSVK